MEIVLFIVLAGVWAALLLPSFFDSRLDAPINSTQNFARNTARLAAVRAMATEPGYAVRRSRTLGRRRRVMIGLIGMAVSALAAAIVTGSVALLGLSIVADLLLAGYVALLIHLKQQGAVVAPIPLYTETAQSDQAQVRVLAG